MDYKRLAEIIFPDVDKDISYYENIYPERTLPEGAKVTRIGPSPTGFVHFGTLYQAVLNSMLARQSGGVFFLRIEDTDSKRLDSQAEGELVHTISYFGISFDESPEDGEAYGPYRQSQRREIYRTFAKHLLSEGKAYPCFCTAEELAAAREKQESEKKTPGYYGEYALWRDRSFEDIEMMLAEGKPFVLRFRSQGSEGGKIKVTDQIKGNLELSENYFDHVLLKSDGMPTYHLAHVVDDRLMRTTHVVRGEEWLSSLPFHLQLFEAFSIKPPKYAHTAQILKQTETGKKKLSKRDKGASLRDYIDSGYCARAVVEYILTLINSNFEDWRRANPDTDYASFPLALKKMSVSGCLFDEAKLEDISRNVISCMSAEQVYERTAEWASEYDTDFYDIFTRDKDYSTRVLAIGRGGKKPRKDIALWSGVKDYACFFYDELFYIRDELPGNITKNDARFILQAYSEEYVPAADRDEWFDAVKVHAEKNGFCPDVKQYKADSIGWKGHVGDVSTLLRLAITGRESSPDLYEIITILGEDRVRSRLENFAATLK